MSFMNIEWMIPNQCCAQKVNSNLCCLPRVENMNCEEKNVNSIKDKNKIKTKTISPTPESKTLEPTSR